jgi:hypothetical protein
MQDLVPLSIVSLEVRESADSLAAKLSDSLIVADELGRKCIPASTAKSLILAEAERRYADAEAQRKRQTAFNARIRAVQEKHRPRRGVPLNVPEGTPPAAAMVAADGAPQYDGGTYRPVPSAADWAFGGAADTGGTFGPPPRPRRKKGDSK